MQTIERIQKHAETIKAGEHEQVKPGMPWAFTEAASTGDGAWQGDLGLEVVAKIPDDYVKVAKPKVADQQLVSGNTQGSKHCLDSLAGVTLYRPMDWNEESLRGPAFELTKERTVLHPTHGSVTIPAGFKILCRYQREFDKVLQQERRAQD